MSGNLADVPEVTLSSVLQNQLCKTSKEKKVEKHKQNHRIKAVPQEAHFAVKRKLSNERELGKISNNYLLYASEQQQPFHE